MGEHPSFDSSESLQIYQDNCFYDPSFASSMISHAPMPAAPRPKNVAPRRPLQPNNGNSMFHPPMNASMTGQSPFKPAPHAPAMPLAPLKQTHAGKLNMVPMMPPHFQAQPTDSMPKKQPLMSRFKAMAQKPAVMGAAGALHMGKENMVHPVLYPAANPNLSIQNQYQKPPGKRLLEAPAIKESRPQKRQKLDDNQLPPHDSFPPVVDDGSKPGHSYAMLIGMAIMRSPLRRLTLSQIYKWISDNYSFYSPNDAGWQNSIRHNLSLNKNFVKKERPKDDPGKGNYWAIEPGTEHIFLKEKPTRKSISVPENHAVLASSAPEPVLPATRVKAETTDSPTLAAGPAPVTTMVPAPHATPTLGLPLAPAPPAPPMLPTLPAPRRQATEQPEQPSSDATIIVSDNVAPEELPDNTVEADGVLESNVYSPLPPTMHSSPPVPRHLDVHGNTPPPVPRRQGSSAARSHRRQIQSMDDSGYISSLDSSVLRPNQNGDRPRIKRGRAEIEIARIRNSPYESPTQGRSWGCVFGPQSSSPLRRGSGLEAGQMLPPLTPALKLQPPPQPPPSVSPNTNLRLHRDKVREMVDSPLRRALGIDTPLPDDQSLYNSTMLNFEMIPGLECGFDIYPDQLFPASMWGNGSPAKRSVKKPRMDRAHSASDILADTSNSNSSRRSANLGSHLKAASICSPAGIPALDTPSKVFTEMPISGPLSSPSKYFLPTPSKVSNAPEIYEDENADVWPDLNAMEPSDLFLQQTDFDALDENSENCTVDIMQGFDRIGGSRKPAFGRSNTTTF